MERIKNIPSWVIAILKVLLGVFITIVVIYIIPRTINYIILKPATFEIVGDGTHWLSFWGSYLGAIISAGVAFFILAIQYRQNKKENERNRNLQINVIKHQQELEQLHSIIKISSDLILSVNPIEIMRLSRQIGIINSSLMLERLRDIVLKVENHEKELSLYIDADRRVKNKNLVLKIGNYTFNYITVLKDIENLIVIFNRYNNDLKTDDFKDTGLFGENVTIELQNVILEYELTKKTNLSYVDCRSIAIKRIEQIIDLQSNLQNEITDYIESEKKRINQILIEQ